MVFSINPATTGNKTMADFKALAIKQNGTNLVGSGLQSTGAAAAAPSTVTVSAGAGMATPPPAAAAPPSVAQGNGKDGQGIACSCQCLCGVSSFPQNAAINNFGGFAGMIS